MFVLAWWARLVTRDEEKGRRRATNILKSCVQPGTELNQVLASPIYSFFISCKSVHGSLLFALVLITVACSHIYLNISPPAMITTIGSLHMGISASFRRS